VHYALLSSSEPRYSEKLFLLFLDFTFKFPMKNKSKIKKTIKKCLQNTSCSEPALINIHSFFLIKFQLICAFGANLMYVCTGLVFACSGYLIPQLENSVNNTSLKKMGENGSDLSSPKNHDVGFEISPEEGSWVGNGTIF